MSATEGPFILTTFAAAIIFPLVLSVWIEYPVFGPILFITTVVGFVVVLHQLLTLTIPQETRSRDPNAMARLLLWVGSLEKADCGCLYDAHSFRSSLPRRKESDGAPEPDFVWKCKTDGARLTYRLYKQELQRCTNCGGFAYVESTPNASEISSDVYRMRYTQWVDEPLPDIVAESGYEIVEVDA